MKKAEKKLKDKDLDALWSSIIHLRGACEVCGRKDTLNAHHIFSRSNKSVRWDLDNGVLLCVSHHLFGNDSAHKCPIEFCEWIKKKRGKLWYERLRKQAQRMVKCDILYRRKQFILLTEELNAIRSL